MMSCNMDWMEQEQERGNNYFCCNYLFGETTGLIIIDSGHVDFTIEVERSLKVLTEQLQYLMELQVEPQSETVWRQADKYKVPRICCK